MTDGSANEIDRHIAKHVVCFTAFISIIDNNPSLALVRGQEKHATELLNVLIISFDMFV